MANEEIVDDLVLVIGKAKIHGRGGPTATIDAVPYGLSIRIDFESAPAMWAEVLVSFDEIETMAKKAKAFFAKQQQELEAIKKRRMTANGDKLS